MIWTAVSSKFTYCALAFNIFMALMIQRKNILFGAVQGRIKVRGRQRRLPTTQPHKILSLLDICYCFTSSTYDSNIKKVAQRAKQSNPLDFETKVLIKEFVKYFLTF